MTVALCLNCGGTKPGALCPCPACGAASTGNMGLDTAFSDRRMSPATLAGFGAVVRAIRRVCGDDERRFWAFVHYAATRHPEVLGADLTEGHRRACEAVVEWADPPPVAFERSEG
jgi:hypothetical protein